MPMLFFLPRMCRPVSLKMQLIGRPSSEDVHKWHEAAWNISIAPLLWIVTPTEVRLYDCYASPHLQESNTGDSSQSLGRFDIFSEERLRALDMACGRLATETGAFWASSIGARINRRHRVDQELLAEINALEQRLIKLSSTEGPEAQPVARDLAQRIIGRCIFTWYLIDRGLAQPFLPREIPPDLSTMFATSENAFGLFDWLRNTFNGDLFPMDDPGAERQHLTNQHLELIREFIEGRSLISGRQGQGRLFKFRFNAIPIELISAIYQQFARSSAADAAQAQGLHYTPVELVHMTLDAAFEGISPSARVVDLTCGSGAFLVEAFRRLVWRAAGDEPTTRRFVRRVLYTQLYGMDINRTALGIAAFSLYLAALELDDEPIDDIEDLKFDHLIDKTLFQTDSLSDELPEPIAARSFDAIVGNPPWTFVRRHGGSTRRVEGASSTYRPRRSPDQAFLKRAAEVAGDSGRIGMVMKATPFFSKDRHAVDARNELFRTLSPITLLNLSYLRRERLFPDAVGPAVLFFSRCALGADPERLLVGSIPWTPDFKRTGVFHIGPSEVNSVSLKRVLNVPALLKAVTFGTVRDGILVEKLERIFPRLDNVLERLGLNRSRDCGQGFQVNGDRRIPPRSYYSMHVVTHQTYRAFRVNEYDLERFSRHTLHRPRRRTIFEGPLLLCPNSAHRKGPRCGRYSAAIHFNDVLYPENFFGISFRHLDPVYFHVLSGILNSTLTTFQLAFGGPTWGLERPNVKPNAILSLRVPCLSNIDRSLLDSVAHAEQGAADEPDNPQRLAALDESVFDLYELEREERLLASTGIDRVRHLIFEGRQERLRLTTSPDTNTLREYAAQVTETINTYLRARGHHHVEATIYEHNTRESPSESGIPGVAVVRFFMAPDGPGPDPIIYDGVLSDLNPLDKMLRGFMEGDTLPYLNERRQLRIYRNNDLFILKPTEVRYWTRTAGLNDADIILADHWFRRQDATIHI